MGLSTIGKIELRCREQSVSLPASHIHTKLVLGSEKPQEALKKNMHFSKLWQKYFFLSFPKWSVSCNNKQRTLIVTFFKKYPQIIFLLCFRHKILFYIYDFTELIRSNLKKTYWKTQMNPRNFDLIWNLSVSILAAESFINLKTTKRT